MNYNPIATLDPSQVRDRTAELVSLIRADWPMFLGLVWELLTIRS